MIKDRIKFFKRSIALVSEGAEATSDDGTDPTVILNEDGEESWVSPVDDGSQVTISVSFPQGVVNRILLVDHNIANFRIVGDFEGTTDINNNNIPDGAIDVVNNNKKTSYFAFNEKPNLANIQLELGETFPSGINKRIGRIIICEELGTFKGYPVIREINFSQNSRNVKSKGGPELITKQNRTLKRIPLQFRNYTEIDDIQLVESLFLSQTPFLIWPCGGNESQFKFPITGYRLQDIYKVQTKGDFRTSFKDGSYEQLISATATFAETV